MVLLRRQLSSGSSVDREAALARSAAHNHAAAPHRPSNVPMLAELSVGRGLRAMRALIRCISILRYCIDIMISATLHCFAKACERLDDSTKGSHSLPVGSASGCYLRADCPRAPGQHSTIAFS